MTPYKILREVRGLTQQAVADMLGVSQEMVSQIERGIRPVPSQAGDEGKVNRELLDGLLAIGDGDDGGLFYALGRLSQDDELALFEPVAAMRGRDAADAAAGVLAALGHDETVVVPVRPSLIEGREGEVLDRGEDVLLRVTEYLRAVEPHDRERVVFGYEDLLPVDDPVARWITVVGMAWNDLEVANRRLIVGLSAHGPHRQTFRDSRVVAACVWEISKFLRESHSEAEFPEVVEFVGELPADVRKDCRDALAATAPDAEDTWFKAKLANARDKASHYPALRRRDLKAALRKLASEQGSIEAGGRFGDVQAGFADDVAVNLFFASDPDRWREEFGRFLVQLQRVVVPLLRFLWEALAAYFRARPGTWKRE